MKEKEEKYEYEWQGKTKINIDDKQIEKTQRKKILRLIWLNEKKRSWTVFERVEIRREKNFSLLFFFFLRNFYLLIIRRMCC